MVSDDEVVSIATDVAVTERLAQAASAWVKTLSEPERALAVYPFDDAERFDWHYVPRRRNGLRKGDMTSRKHAAALDLLRSAVSKDGFFKALRIMLLEDELRRIEGSPLSRRDPDNYAFTVFGTPGTFPWGWRIEGHHLSINLTVAAPGRLAITPTFTGSNPARIPSGRWAGDRVMAAEYHRALDLGRTLDVDQRSRAVLQPRSMGDIITGPGRDHALQVPEGLPFPALRPDQQARLLDLVEVYVGLAREDIASSYMDRVREGGLEALHFAWAGGMEDGTAFYYRIHGPRILIEFDNTQNNANHIHAVWRDPVNDFGRDDLRRHYETAGRDHGH